jgi:hypothetical protein
MCKKGAFKRIALLTFGMRQALNELHVYGFALRILAITIKAKWSYQSQGQIISQESSCGEKHREFAGSFASFSIGKIARLM